ncbi:MAG: peptidoglycan recognition protein family protein, partial [Planctomycetota bacterium]
MIDGASLECHVAGGIALYDIRHLLATHPHKRYDKRVEDITALFIHHSGLDSGRDELSAITPMANWHVFHKKWAAIGYQYAITKRPLLDCDGQLVVLRVGSDSTIRAHTRGCNTFGDGLVLQGDGNVEGPSPFQIECLEGFLPWWA